MPVRGGPRYLPSPYEPSLFQGDVIDGVPVLGPSPKTSEWILLVPSEKGTVTREEAIGGKRPSSFTPRTESAVPDVWSFSRSEVVVAKVTKAPVILVTQTCDIDHRKYYHVAPLKKVSDLENVKKIESLRNDAIGYAYYLPACPPVLGEERYADLTLITPVHRSYFKVACVLCRFTNTERTFFQNTLAGFYGSPFGFNRTDKVKQAGQYSCVRCFHGGHHVTTTIETGEFFPPCERCGDDSLWLKING